MFFSSIRVGFDVLSRNAPRLMNEIDNEVEDMRVLSKKEYKHNITIKYDDYISRHHRKRISDMDIELITEKVIAKFKNPSLGPIECIKVFKFTDRKVIEAIAYGSYDISSELLDVNHEENRFVINMICDVSVCNKYKEIADEIIVV